MKNPLFTNTQAAEMGLLISDVMETYQTGDPHALRRHPLPGSRLAEHWMIKGYLVANDTVGFLDPQCWRFYGVLAQQINTGNYSVILRGTGNREEWMNDIKCILVSHPTPGAGKVEEGFFDTYQNMRYLPASADGNTLLSGVPGDYPRAATGIYEVVKDGSVVITGHSLGAALVTYLAFDLAHLNAKEKNQAFKLQSCLFASPRTGDQAFVNAFDRITVGHYVLYDYVRDIVPDLPPHFWVTAP